MVEQSDRALNQEPEAAGQDCHGLDTPERVRFYEHDFYVLSNFSAFNVSWGGFRFQTSEHLYHYMKFARPWGDEARREPIDFSGPEILVAQAIFGAPSAHEAFKIAEQNRELRRPDWDHVKVSIMRDILRAKAMQHSYVLRKLFATGDRELVEDSWRDDFWGWGPNRDGQNMLGKLWMQVRAELRGTETPQAASGSSQGARSDYPEAAALLCERFARDFTTTPPKNEFEHGVQTATTRLAEAFRGQPEALEPSGSTYGIIDPDYGRAYTIARKLAWEEGYAIGLHGSFTRDLDLVAVPWVEKPCEPFHLVRRIVAATGLKLRSETPGAKPQGRLVWTLLFPSFGDPRFVDFSVIPPARSGAGSEEGQ